MPARFRKIQKEEMPMQRNKLSRRHCYDGSGRRQRRDHPALAGQRGGIQLQAGLVVADGASGDGAPADRRQQDQAGNQRAAGDHHLSEQRPRRRHGDDRADDLRRDGDVQPADRSAGAAQSGLRHSRRRLRLPRLSTHVWAAMDGDLGNMLRGAGGTDRPLLPRQGLRPRLPPDHHAHQADHQPGRPARASRSACRSRRI